MTTVDIVLIVIGSLFMITQILMWICFFQEDKKEENNVIETKE